MSHKAEWIFSTTTLLPQFYSRRCVVTILRYCNYRYSWKVTIFIYTDHVIDSVYSRWAHWNFVTCLTSENWNDTGLIIVSMTTVTDGQTDKTVRYTVYWVAGIARDNNICWTTVIRVIRARRHCNSIMVVRIIIGLCCGSNGTLCWLAWSGESAITVSTASTPS